MEINCESYSFVEFLNRDISQDAFKQNAHVGVVVGDKALFVTNHSILDYRTRYKQAFTICMLLANCRAEGDALGFSNTLCLVRLVSPSVTKEEWLAEVRQQLLTGNDHKVAG